MQSEEKCGETKISLATFENLKKTKPWVIFFSIFGISIIGMGLLGGLYTLIAESLFQGIISMLLNGIILIPFIYLLNYGNQIGDLIDTDNSLHFDEAIRNQRIYWQWVGSFTILIIALIVIIVIAIISFGDILLDNIINYPLD